MISPEQRQVFLNYLSLHASDSVLLEAVEQAEREYDAALLKATNMMNAGKRKPVEEKTPIGVQVETQQATINRHVFGPIFAGELPKKLAAVGQEAVDFVKRANKDVSVVAICKAISRPERQVRPQLALAVSRGLLVQTGESQVAKA